MSDGSPDPAETKLLHFLVGLVRSEDLELALNESLRLLVAATAATTAYLELGNEANLVALAWPDKDSVGRGVVAHAVSRGALVHSASARNDPRFRQLESVRRNSIDAVLCAPFEWGALTGAVYVHRSANPEPFSERHSDLLGAFVTHVGAVATRLLPDTNTGDGTLRAQTRRFQEQVVRRALARTNGNVARTARDLRITRTFVYRLTPLVSRRRTR